MATLNAYIHFKGNAKEAMEFYQSIFGGKLDIMPFKGSQMESMMPAEAQDNVLHSYLKSGDLELMASDMVEDGDYKVGNAMSLCLVCSSKEEIETHFKKLSEGGKVGHGLNEEFFGIFGDLVDKFGMPWMLQYSTPGSMQQ